jgi:hypothetical protein
MSRLLTHAVCLASLLVLISATAAQDTGGPLVVHVKEVKRVDGDSGEHGTWFDITAVMESKTIVYSVKCREFYRYDDHKYTLRCFPIAAGKDYSGKRLATGISLWPPNAKDDEYKLGLYTIVSEKEK